MKKRLICLFLCLVTVLSLVLTSCSKKTEEESKDNISGEASEAAVTLTMWVVSEEKVSDAAAAAVTEKLNAITKPKFKTELVLTYLTEGEYEEKLAQTVTAYEEAKKNQVVVETTAPAETESGEGAVVTDETETNQFGQSVIKYPELVANQVDIIYISGEDMYIDFIEKGWLAELDAELSSSSKKIKEYVSATLLSAAKYNGATYAVPNNRVIGEYTYMLLNKDLMATYAQDAYAKLDMIDGFYNEYLYSFLKLVRQFESDTVIPIDSSYDFCLDLLAHYWYVNAEDYSLDLDKFSLFGYHYDNIADLNRGSTVLGYNSLFEDKEFVADYLQLNRFRMDDYFRKENDTRTESAIKFVTGSYADLAQYEEDYYSVIVEYPTASSEDIYGNMFGVCTYSRNLSRSMEIITYMNTNAAFRNLLQYGVEGVHYKTVANENGVISGIERLNSDYVMDIYATGNMFIAYPDTEKGMTNEVWESGKIQNRSSLVDPLLGLDFAEYSSTTTPEAETEKVSDVGYNLKYSTGYSKYVMMQNATIAAWINECDAIGQGVYVLETKMDEGQYRTLNYYIYNNMGKTSFSVEDIREVETSYDEKTDKTIETQTNLDFVLTYAPASGSGYELSMMTLYTRKANDFEVLCKVDDVDTPITFKKMDGLLTVDLLNTEQYTIELFDTVTRASFVKNNTLYNWITSLDTKHADKNNVNRDKTTNYLLTYEGTNAEGKKEYTYVFYRCKQKFETVMSVQPTGDSGKLNLAFNLVQDDEYPTDTTLSKYSLCYVRVTVNDNNIVPTYTVLVDGEKQTIPEANIVKSTVDPDYTLLGNLDTELVKFIQTLNDELIGFLDAKYAEYSAEYKQAIASIAGNTAADNAARRAALDAAMEKLEVVIDEIGYVLSTKAAVPAYTEAALPNLYGTDLIKKYLVDDNTTTNETETDRLTLLHRYVLNAVSVEPLKITTLDADDNVVDAFYGGTESTGEPYVYYDSIYGIYHSWLEKYGYLPKEK